MKTKHMCKFCGQLKEPQEMCCGELGQVLDFCVECNRFQAFDTVNCFGCQKIIFTNCTGEINGHRYCQNCYKQICDQLVADNQKITDEAIASMREVVKNADYKNLPPIKAPKITKKQQLKMGKELEELAKKNELTPELLAQILTQYDKPANETKQG